MYSSFCPGFTDVDVGFIVALYNLQSWSKCEAGGLSLDMFQTGSEVTEQAFRDRSLECPDFAGQFMLRNIPEDGDFSEEDAAENEDRYGPDDIGVTPEELEAELLLNLRDPRVELNASNAFVSTEGNLID